MCDCAVPCCEIAGRTIFEYILFCHILWWVSYYSLLVISRRNEEWCCRFLTLIHGCIISYSAIADIIKEKSAIDFEPIPLSQEKIYYLSYMLSYFLFDICWIHFFGNEPWIIYVHHSASILIIINIFWKNYGSIGISYAAAGLELSNPYLQLRWFLRTHGYQNKTIYIIAEIWFIVLFFIIRIIGGTTLLYCAMISTNTDNAMKISVISIYGISLVLQWQIFMYIKKKLRRRGLAQTGHHITCAASISVFCQKKTLECGHYEDNFFEGNFETSEDDTKKESGDDLTEFSEPMESSEFQEPTEAQETSESPEDTEALESSGPAETSEPSEPPQPAELAEPEEPPGSSETPKSSKSPKSTD